jgi:hypothetical protein
MRHDFIVMLSLVASKIVALNVLVTFVKKCLAYLETRLRSHRTHHLCLE